MKRTISSLILLLSACSLLTAVPRIGRTQTHIIRGRFDAPPRGHVLAPDVPVTISWAIDDAASIDSQDLILSTDGGATFKIKIAAHLPREQRQLIWGIGPANATERARLKLVLHSVSGEVEEVLSDDFSISPFPRAPAQPSASAQDLEMYDAHSKSAPAADAQDERVDNNESSTGRDAADKVEVTPSFANPGSCTTAEVPVLNYNMNHPTPCFPYDGEPALAQDPTNPKRFFIATGQASEISSTAQWAFSGSSFANAFDFGSQTSRGDLTVEVGSDGTVYATALAQPIGGSFPDRILIFRSKNHGVSFEPGVVVPNVPAGQFVDKPVLAVNPLDSETLVITFNISLTPGSRVVICKQASTGVLSNPNIWGISIPRSQFGGDLSDQGSTHPLIDPIDSNTFRLFVVQTNYTYSQTEAGYAVYQYQLSKGQLALNNANLQRILPAEVLVNGSPVGAQHWTINSSHQAIETALRVSQGTSNFTKAAIDYCDPSAHRMYIPTLVNTTNNPNFPDGGLTSDLFLTVWQYTGTESVATKRILPGEKEKYVACAVTDGHGRVWVDAFIIASDPNNYQNMDNQRAQKGVIAINRRTGDPGAIAYMSGRLPGNVPAGNLFLGDYIYTQAGFYPDPNNPANVNGLGSRVSSPTFTDAFLGGGCSLAAFWVEVSGWN